MAYDTHASSSLARCRLPDMRCQRAVSGGPLARPDAAASLALTLGGNFFGFTAPRSLGKNGQSAFLPWQHVAEVYKHELGQSKSCLVQTRSTIVP
jgi:hypothetical protein